MSKVLLAICATFWAGASVSAQLVWKPKQQVLILPSVTTAQVTDSLMFTAVARTSGGTLIAAPSITWTLRNAAGVSLVKRTNQTIAVFPTAVMTPRTTWLVAAWKTATITFYDSTLITLAPFDNMPRVFVGPLTTPPIWNTGQQLIIRPTYKQAVFLPVVLTGGTQNFTTLARTAAKTPVTAYAVTWQLRDATYAHVKSLTATIGQVSVDSQPPASYVTWLVATWTTKAGAIRDSTKVIISTLSYIGSVAMQDSFPPSNRGFRLASLWGKKLSGTIRDSLMNTALALPNMTTLQLDSIRASWKSLDSLPDSLYTVQDTTPKKVTVLAGYRYSACYIGKNRYTGATQVFYPRDSLGIARCDSARQLFSAPRKP